jgi:hypothetical protein
MVGCQYNGKYRNVQIFEEAQRYNVDRGAMKRESLKVLCTKEVPVCKKLISVLNEMIYFS